MAKPHCPHCGHEWDMQLWPGMDSAPDLTDEFAVTMCWVCQKLTNVRFVMGVMTLSAPSAEDMAAYEEREDVREMRAMVRGARRHGS